MVRHKSIRTVLAIVAQQNMYIVQFDICTAFLHNKMDTELYMRQPIGFVDQANHDLVCLILQSLYGFKQSRCLWNKKFNAFLIKFDLHPTSADPCVYISGSEPPLIVTLFVDDGLACCISQSKLERFISHMEKHFTITRSEADLYVGMHIRRDRSKRLLYIDQSLYLRRLLARFEMENCAPVSTPADPNVKFDHSFEPLQDPPFEYLSAIGCLMFAQTLSRVDIAYAVNILAHFGSSQQQSHYQGVIRIFRYLAGTLDLALCYDGNIDSVELVAYADVDYAGDILDRKSRTGSLLQLNGSLVSWCNRKQACVATSPTEFEYIGAYSTTKDVLWLRRLLSNLRFHQKAPTQLYSDNQSAIRLVHNPEFHRRTKHIDIIYHFIWEHQLLCKTSTSATYQLQISSLIFSRSLFRLIIFSYCVPAFTFFPYLQWKQWFQQPRLFDRCSDRTSCGVVGLRESIRDIDVDDSSCPVGRLCALLEAGL